ncbi:MAG: DNA repair protein RecN [Candidatus Eremiobacteraeota bacterium]|nr:DNA repair protein RecN [Candidatus Eremiobacteraeota bacterium]
MLRRLDIENYGLIDRATIAFSEAATMFTGETGSGKTMILGALGFALGARAHSDVVRRGASKAVVTLAFEPDEMLAKFLGEAGFELDPGEEATIVREIGEAGKSNVRLNGRPATASFLRDMAEHVVEIVGQHEAQRLLVPSYHLELLDRFAGVDAARARALTGAAHAELVECERGLAALQSGERKAQADYEDARFTLDEIEAAAPEPGEDVLLAERRRFLDNIERVAAALRAAHEALSGEDASAGTSLGVASAALASIADIGNELREIAAAAAALQGEANELAARIARELDDTEFDPLELDAVSARLDALDRLKRKYGGSIEDVLERAETSRSMVRNFERRDEAVEELRTAVARARAELVAHASVLSALRQGAAQRLARSVSDEFKDLALASGRFAVEFSTLDRIVPTGAESAELTFAANAGESVRPLSRVASGGELSRVLLALAVVLAQARERTALVFDEIDAGIGGATGTAVGERIGRLARDGQVVCVTHLAQLATWADRHYLLEKHETKTATTIAVREIEGDETRAAELARMLSGEAHDVALAHARTLLHQASRARA